MKGKIYAVIALVSAALLAASGWFIHQQGYSHGKADADATWEIRWYGRDAADKTAQLAQEVAARTEERRRADEMEKITREDEARKSAYAVTVAAAGIAGDGLRTALDAVRNGAGTGDYTGSTCDATSRARDRKTIIVLTGLYDEADRRAEERARFADESYAALKACNAAYSAIRNHTGTTTEGNKK